jgi:hypothetical protein
MKVCCGF